MPLLILHFSGFFLVSLIFSLTGSPSAIAFASAVPNRTTTALSRLLFVPYLRVPMFHFKEHSKGAFQTKSLRLYQSTADLVPLPDQPNRMVQMLFSIIISDTNFTQPINRAIIECVVRVTSTQPQHLGVYEAQAFTTTQIQAEYFADVSEQDSITFPEKLDPYIRRGNLTRCVRDQKVGFAPEASLLSGRTTIAPRTEEIVSSTGSVPGWAVGALIGVLGLLALIALIGLAVPGNAVYSENDYEQEVMEGGRIEPEVDDNGLSQRFKNKISAELRAIAGQRQGALLAPS